MSVKNIIILFLTILVVILTVFILSFQYFYEVPKNQNDDIEEVLFKLTKEIENKTLTNKTISSFKSDLFYVIWIKNKKEEWIPKIYDKNRFKNTTLYPDSVPKNLSNNVKIVKKKIGSFNYIVWGNRFSLDYYIANILILFLFIALIYLILLFLITILFGNSKKEEIEEKQREKENKDERLDYNLTEEEFDGLLSDYNEEDEEEPINKEPDLEKEKITDDYKDLWIKHFKISDNFKSNFPFEKIYNLLKFGTKPEDYIKDGLEIAKEYFGFVNPKIYVSQKNVFVDPLTKEILPEEKIEIPLKGDKKGDVCIPLFPYTIKKLFGYFYFEWNKSDNFLIADILYFLKYFFSEEAKTIFLNHKEQEDTIEYLKEKMEKKGDDVFVAIIGMDNIDKIKLDLKNTEKEKLNKNVLDKVLDDFGANYIFNIPPFCVGIIGEDSNKEKEIEKIEKWISDIEKHNYPISNQYGNIALSFSCGISFKNNRNIHPLTLINEAENYLKIARMQGGNQIVSD